MTSSRIMTKSLNIATSPQMLNDLRQAARRMGVSTPQVARMALALYLERGIDYGPAKNTNEVTREQTSAAG